MSSYFYLQAEKNELNADILERLQRYSEENKILIYVLNRPLTNQKYNYKYDKSLIVLSPKSKIAIIDFGTSKADFLDYVEDVIEDIGSLSDKYLYKEVIGRPRKWRENLVDEKKTLSDLTDIKDFFKSLEIANENDQKKLDLLISLFIGSINYIEKVKLDKIKQNIQLFNGDQARFLYEKPDTKKIRIKKFSSLADIDLFLHKMKNLYISDIDTTIFLTCYNKKFVGELRDRIPVFFSFLKVEQQIEWDKKFWCAEVWGSSVGFNSGAYRYICELYRLSFNPPSHLMTFKKACQIAIEDIKAKFKDGVPVYAFTYMFIADGEYFDPVFFELCELVTEKNIYIAGEPR